MSKKAELRNTKEQFAPQTVGQAVANLYSTFRRYKAPTQTLDVCLACCMDVKLEREMRQLPLASLCRNHFYQYNNSAKSQVQPASEIKYLIPRLFELLSQGVDVHHSTEIFLDRVGRVPEDTYSDAERKALDDFAFEFFAAGLKQMPFEENGYFQRDGAFSILLMFDIGGFNVKPLLEHWLRQDTEVATLHYAYSTLWHFWLDGGEIGMPFACDRPAFRETMKTWINEPKHRQLYTKRILDCATQLAPEVLQAGIGNYQTHEDVLDEVLGYVTE